MGHQSKLIDDFKKLAESANETELAVYSSIISSLQSKRELDHYSYISNLLKLEATFSCRKQDIPGRRKAMCCVDR